MTTIKSLLYFLTIVLITISSLIAQTEQFPPQREISRDSLLIYARIIVDSADSRVLVTVDQEGKPQARTMSPFPPEENWVIWLGTFPTSRKVKQIQNNPNVVVFYYDTKSYSYVSISGKARLVNDPDLKAKYWKSGWKRFYPDRDKDYVLIEVTPVKLEICSFEYELLWNPEGLPASVDFGENQVK
ncbi:MAG: pyridoxamine 5'-phosphate oxidase family protein [Ignavibacteriaceae bacterium]|jgi:general stress protein 26|nr:pyridoxamine 5'-phosphate oxidase family protein [Ignavibacteriaceae bacterium]